MQTHGALPPFELAELTHWLSRQLSDSWDEGFKQREIKVENGELYVSFNCACCGCASEKVKYN